MNGAPPVYSVRPDSSAALSFLALMLASARPGPAVRYQQPARGWLDAYHVRRCGCGGAGMPGARCYHCGQVVP